MSKKYGAYLPGDLIHSKAYLALKGVAPQLLSLFWSRGRWMQMGKKGKGRWIATNNGEIVFTYSEAKRKFGISKKRFAKGLKELHDKGFLDVSKLGGAYQGDPSLYALSDRWRKYDTDEFAGKDWPKDKVQRGYRNKRKK